MKILSKATTFVTASLFAICLNAQQIATVQELKIQSKILNQERPVLVYTPLLYNDHNLVSYDVIYVFDAQNREIFDMVHASLGFIGFSQKFIVVGISSPSYPETEYYRNSDYLPVPINNPEYYGTSKPNAENFWRYVQQEVFPFIQSQFRTTGTKFAIGHSLSASFVLDKALNAPDVFKGTIAISPNYAYDEYRLANDFIKKDFEQANEKKFLYTSQADEAVGMPETWAIGYEKVKNHIASKKDFGKYTLVTKEFPEEDHWNGYPVSLRYGLRQLYGFVENNPAKPQGKTQTITFKVTVPDKEDIAYITGNQESLGSWDPGKIKMDRVSDFEREIKLKVRFPLEFKITRGSWKSEGGTDQNDKNNIVISSANNGNEISLKVLGWFDK